MELQGIKINFLGDSITEGAGVSAPERRYPDLIAAETGAVCRNYGISGSRIARQYRPSADVLMDRDFCSRVAEMEPDADVVVVFGGTNDFGHGDAPFGQFSDRTSDTFCGALHVLYRALLERYPQAYILILTPLHRLEEDCPRGDGSKEADAPLLQTYVEAIRETAAYYALPVLDLWATSGLQPQVPVIRERYMPDGLHPNDAGHEKLAAAILRVLRQL